MTGSTCSGAGECVKEDTGDNVGVVCMTVDNVDAEFDVIMRPGATSCTSIALGAGRSASISGGRLGSISSRLRGRASTEAGLISLPLLLESVDGCRAVASHSAVRCGANSTGLGGAI